MTLTETPPVSPPPSPRSIRLRRAISISISTAVIIAAMLVLSIQIFDPSADAEGRGAAALLMRLFDTTSQFWFLPPVLALLLSAGLPRIGEVPALPAVLGSVALGLLALCHVMPALRDGTLLPLSWLGG